MKKKYTITLDGKGIEEALGDIDIWKQWLKDKANELAEKLAQHGYEKAKVIIGNHVFNGDTLSGLRVEQIDIAHYVLKVESQAILFLEFGTGLGGYGHPEPMGYGPGTYPGKGHWDDPKGWWFPTDDSRLAIKRDEKGQGWGHTYGMAPAMPMYEAHKAIEQDIQAIAREVLKT